VSEAMDRYGSIPVIRNWRPPTIDVRTSGAHGYRRDVVLPDGTTHQGRTSAHWRRVALIVAKRTGHAVGVDTATRMLARERSTDGDVE
jgi:hypothetical protein